MTPPPSFKRALPVLGGILGREDIYYYAVPRIMIALWGNTFLPWLEWCTGDRATLIRSFQSPQHVQNESDHDRGSIYSEDVV